MTDDEGRKTSREAMRARGREKARRSRARLGLSPVSALLPEAKRQRFLKALRERFPAVRSEVIIDGPHGRVVRTRYSSGRVRTERLDDGG